MTSAIPLTVRYAEAPQGQQPPPSSLARWQEMGIQVVWGNDPAQAAWTLELRGDEDPSPELLGFLPHLSADAQAAAYALPVHQFVLGRRMTSMDLRPRRETRLTRTARAAGPTQEIEAPIHRQAHPGIDAYLRWAEQQGPQRDPNFTNLVTAIPYVFLREYVARAGWRDGFSGYLWASLKSIAEFLAQMKAWTQGAM